MARRGELLPYLENLRDQFSLPMVYVSHQFEEVLRLAGDVVVLDDGAVAGHGDVIAMSQSQALRDIIGTESLGAVVEGATEEVEVAGPCADPRRRRQLLVESGDLRRGHSVRVQLLARDLILATSPPVGLSVRNSLAGTIARSATGRRPCLAGIYREGGVTLMVRVTDEARGALALR